VLPYLIRAFPEWEWILFCRNEAAALEFSGPSNVRIKESKWMRSEWFWKLAAISFESKVEKLDLLFVPVSRLPPWKPCASAVVIHDMGFVSRPEYLSRGALLRTSLNMRHAVCNSDILLVNSEFTKREIDNTYGPRSSPSVVTYCGYDPRQFNPQTLPGPAATRILDQYGIRRPYVLYLGVIQGRKNLGRLIEASELWRQDDPHLQLVLAGKRGWNCDEVYRRSARFSVGEVCMPGPIQPEDLKTIYQMAECYVLPSIYEGFGIPALEAMACGTPVILSATSALPEVGGESALYFDPLRPQEMAEKVLLLRKSPQVRREMIAAGLERVKPFTWENCATRIAAAFDQFFQ